MLKIRTICLALISCSIISLSFAMAPNPEVVFLLGDVWNKTDRPFTLINKTTQKEIVSLPAQTKVSINKRFIEGVYEMINPADHELRCFNIPKNMVSCRVLEQPTNQEILKAEFDVNSLINIDKAFKVNTIVDIELDDNSIEIRLRPEVELTNL